MGIPDVRGPSLELHRWGIWRGEMVRRRSSTYTRGARRKLPWVARRTSKISEARNNAPPLLRVRRQRPEVWRSVRGLKDVAMEEAAVTHRDQRQRHPKKANRALVEFQNMVRAMFEEYDSGSRIWRLFFEEKQERRSRDRRYE